MKIVRPLHDRILVRRDEEETRTSGGILIPDSAAEKPLQGEVLAVGTGKPLDNGVIVPLEVCRGDTVLFGKHSGAEVKVEGEELLVLREEDIMCIIEE